MVKKAAMLVAVIIFCMQTAVFAGDLYKTEVRQVYCYSDLLRAYVDAEDSEGNPVPKPKVSNVAGTIDGNKLTVRSVNRFGDTDEGVADIFLIDISGSIKNSQMNQVKSAIRTWAENMKDNDRIAIMTFGESVRSLIDYSNDKNAINSAINQITNDDNLTQLYGGLSEALDLTTRTDNSLPKRKNIILITDGINEYSGGVSESDIYEKIRDTLVPVYSMWMPNGEKGRATLNSVTEYSGGRMYDMSDKNIDTVYSWIRDSIKNTYTMDFAYGSASADGGKHSFNVKVAENGKVAEDNVLFTFKKNTENSGAYTLGDSTAQSDKAATDTEADEENEEGSDKKAKVLIVIGIAAIVAVIATAIILILRKRNYTDEPYTSEIYPDSMSNVSNYQNDNYQAYGSGATVNVNHDSYGAVLYLTPVGAGSQLNATLSDVVSVGRGPANDIVVNDSLVSGQHCVFICENGSVFVEDSLSTNGTILNGVLIKSKTPVNNGDTILIGNSEFSISIV